MNQLYTILRKLSLMITLLLVIQDSSIASTCEEIITLREKLESSTLEQRYQLLSEFKDKYIQQLVRRRRSNDIHFGYPHLGWNHINAFYFKLTIDFKKEIVTIESRNKQMPFPSFQLPFAPKNERLERMIKLHADHGQTNTVREVVSTIAEVIDARNLEPTKTFDQIAGGRLALNYISCESITIDDKEYFKYTPSIPFLLNFTPFLLLAWEYEPIDY